MRASVVNGEIGAAAVEDGDAIALDIEGRALAGGQTFSISSIAITAPFSRNTGGTFPAGAPNCGGSLAAGASCTIKVQYTAPAPAGTVSNGTVTINGNAGVTNSPVSLTGNSVAATGLAAAP